MPGPIDYGRISIQPDFDSAAWFDATKNKEFNLGQCNDCGHKFWPVWPGCAKCSSVNVGLSPIKGEGVIYSYNVVTQPIIAHLVNAVPYIHAIIEIPDGENPDGSKTRVGGLMLDDEEDVGIGAKVKLEWDDHPEQDYKIPRWRVVDKTGVWRYPG